MNDEKGRNPAEQENWRAEYASVTEGWKFFAGLRFLVAAFTVALQSGLFTLYNQVTKDVLIKGPAIKSAAVITIVGMYTILGILLIERRTITFLVKTVRRGVELEFRFGAVEGFFSRLLEPGVFKPRGLRQVATHTGGLVLVYISILALWSYLFVGHLVKLIP